MAPAAVITSPTNSHIYVPLLLDAAGTLDPEAARAWRDDPRCSEWWDDTAAALRELQRDTVGPNQNTCNKLNHTTMVWCSEPDAVGRCNL